MQTKLSRNQKIKNKLFDNNWLFTNKKEISATRQRDFNATQKKSAFSPNRTGGYNGTFFSRCPSLHHMKRLFYMKVDGARNCPCRSAELSWFVVACQPGPAMLVSHIPEKHLAIFPDHRPGEKGKSHCPSSILLFFYCFFCLSPVGMSFAKVKEL